MSATWYGLIEALAGVPNLDGAACATGKRYELFDIEDPDDERAEAARNICGSCQVQRRMLRLVRLPPQGQPPPRRDDRGPDLPAASTGGAAANFKVISAP